MFWLINQSVIIIPPNGSIFSYEIKSRVSKVDFHKSSLIGIEVRLDLLFALERFGSPTDPVLNEPVSVEYVKGPPKIVCLSGSGLGFVIFKPEHEIILRDNIIYKYL